MSKKNNSRNLDKASYKLKKNNDNYIQLTFFNQVNSFTTPSNNKLPEQDSKEASKVCDDCKEQSKDIDFNDFYMEEIEYTQKEKRQVINELSRGFSLGEIHKGISKRELKDWFANITIHCFGEICPNITGNDLVEIANELGLEVKK